MKTPLAVSLVVVGGTLIIAPIVADYLLKANNQPNVVKLLEKPETNRVTLQPVEMSGTYAFGCWLVGTLAIAASVCFSDGRSRLLVQPNRPRHQSSARNDLASRIANEETSRMRRLQSSIFTLFLVALPLAACQPQKELPGRQGSVEQYRKHYLPESDGDRRTPR